MRAIALSLLVALGFFQDDFASASSFTPEDPVLAVLRQGDPNGVRAELDQLLSRMGQAHEDLTQVTDPADERILTELLFLDDVLTTPLRELASGTTTNAVRAEELLWFLGDKSDIAAAEAKLPQRAHRASLLPNGISKADLAEALRTVRDALKLGDNEFRTEVLHVNRHMNKAYVRTLLGPATTVSGWGLMFHLGETGWQLVWSRREWQVEPRISG